MTVTQIWDPVDIAWVAGIIEGEGSIQTRSNANGLNVVVQMTDEDVIRRLRDVTSIGRVSGPYKSSTLRLDGELKKLRWFWLVGRKEEVARLLLAIEYRRRVNAQHAKNSEAPEALASGG